MGGTEFSIGNVVEPLPAFPTILACVHTCERGNNFSIWPGRVDLDTEGPNVGSRFIFISMQKKARVGHALDDICTDRVVNSPTRRQMRASYGADSLDCRIIPHSIDARPLLRVRLPTEGLVAGAYNQRAGTRRLFVTE